MLICFRYLSTLSDTLHVTGKSDCTNRTAVVSITSTKKDNAEVAFQLESEYGILTRVGLHCAPVAHKTLETYPNGTIQPTGVYQEIELIKQCLLLRKKDGSKGHSIPLIVEGTRVTYTDSNDTIHTNVPLKNGMLEILPKSKEYQMLQTDWLFCNIQDMMCSREEPTIRENLTNIFGH